jgi:hypothetical protein
MPTLTINDARCRISEKMFTSEKKKDRQQQRQCQQPQRRGSGPIQGNIPHAHLFLELCDTLL